MHHKKYIKGRMAWEYPDSLLQTLCGRCHLEVHRTTEIKSEKDLYKEKAKLVEKNKLKEKFKADQKAKNKKTKKKQAINKLSKEDRRIQDMWDKLKNRPKRNYNI